MKKNIFWVIVSIIVLAILFNWTDLSIFYQIDIPWFCLAAACFFASTFFWFLAWAYLMKEDFWTCFKINFKSLAGIFSPLGLGSDLLRIHFAKKKKISRTKTLTSSLIVKYFKFLLMFFYLLIAIFLLAQRTVDFPENTIIFISALIITMLGAIIILLMRTRGFTKIIYRLLNRISMLKFNEKLNQAFFNLSLKGASFIILMLIISTVFELAAIIFAFSAINHPMLLIHFFIFGAVIHSLALITVTPQGIGFVEAGGAFVLSMGFFSVSIGMIAAFLIVWNIIRIWIPSIIGLLIVSLDRR